MEKSMKVQSVVPEPGWGPEGTFHRCGLCRAPGLFPLTPLLGKTQSMGTQDSRLMFASANLKNVLVFPFGLGSPPQLPFMAIGPVETVGARGQ